MLSPDLKSRTTWATKNERNLELAARHVKHLRGGIDNLIGCQNGKVEGHEFYDRSQAYHRGAHTQTCKTEFGNRRVDNALVTKLREQSFRDLVRSLIGSDLLTHQKDTLVAMHLFADCLIERFAHCHYDHLRVPLFVLRSDLSTFDGVSVKRIGINVGVEFLRCGLRTLIGEPYRPLDFFVNLLVHFLQLAFRHG